MYFFCMFESVCVEQFAMVEVICGSVVESFPKFWHRRRALLTGIICLTFFVLGLPLTMNVSYFLLSSFLNISEERMT